MNQISLDAKGGQFLADLANWQRESAPDNSADLERLRRNLRFARQPGADEAAAADAGALLRSGTHHGADCRQAPSEPLHRLPHTSAGQRTALRMSAVYLIRAVQLIL